MELPITNMWMIRAGQDGSFIGQFLSNGNADLGWAVGPVNPTDTNENIRLRVREAYPNESPSRLPNIVGMLKRFCCEVRVGDVFVTYDPQRRIYHIGIVKTDANDHPFSWVDPDTGDELHEEWRYVREVNWVSAVGRDTFSIAARRSLNGRLSHFRIREEVSVEIRPLCA